MIIREIEARSLLLPRQKIDSWFISRYGMNLYRGCAHRCVYCDGRSERYHVPGVFGETIVVKRNAVEVLANELHPKRRQAPLKSGYVLLGGGVGDSYQPVEKQYTLTRRTLQLLSEYQWPVHVLTKSPLIERDLALLQQIHQQAGAIVSFSFSSIDDEVSALFEPHTPPPSERLEALRLFKRAGVPCGMFLLPVLPFLTDTPAMIEDAVRAARSVGVDFVLFGGMTLKEGRQKAFYYQLLKDHYPHLLDQYTQIYTDDVWGHPTREYHRAINAVFNQAAKKYEMPRRIPPLLYTDLLWENDLVIVMLEHLAYFMQLEGMPSSFGSAAYALSRIKAPLSTLKSDLRKIKGIGAKTEAIILEILDTKTSSSYPDFQ